MTVRNFERGFAPVEMKLSVRGGGGFNNRNLSFYLQHGYARHVAVCRHSSSRDVIQNHDLPHTTVFPTGGPAAKPDHLTVILETL